MPGIARELRKRNYSALVIEFDPTAASADTGEVLPAGAVVVGVQSLGGATGGTNPTVDIGTSGDPDGFANELDADTAGVMVNTGALNGTALAASTAVYAGVGASAATGGTTKAVIHYVISEAAGAGQ